jgi:hypothetical protein
MSVAPVTPSLRAVDSFEFRVPAELNVLVPASPTGHGLRCPQLLAAADDRHGVSELPEEQYLFHRAVAATDDENVIATVERAVTGRTRR